MSEASQHEATIESRIEAMMFGEPKPGSVPETPAAAAEAPAPEVPEVPAEAAPEGETPAEAKPEAAPEVYEFEWNGGKYQVPPELKELHEGYLRNEDYTRKTQEAAELKRSAELAQQQAATQAELRQALEPHYEKLAVLKQYIAHYQKMDWNALTAKDPVEAQKTFIAYQQVKDMKEKAESELKTAEAEHGQKLSEARAKIIEEGSKMLERDIKGWNPDLAQKLNAFARKSYGFTESEVSNVLDARVVKMMHDAFQWRQLQESKPQVEKRAAQAAKTLKPQGSEPAPDRQQNDQQLKRQIRSAKTDKAREKGIQAWLENRLG